MQAVGVAPEPEVKFYEVSLDEIRAKLTKLGARLKTPERLMRRVVFGGEANPSMVCTYGRVRDEGDVITMSAKFSAVNGNINSQKEAVVTVDSFESAEAILRAFGLVATNYQESKRETWQLADGTLVELEQWPELPDYIEIEGKDEVAVRRAAEQLRLDWAMHTTDSTDKLYRKHFSSLDEEALKQKLADLRFNRLSSSTDSRAG